MIKIEVYGWSKPGHFPFRDVNLVSLNITCKMSKSIEVILGKRLFKELVQVWNLHGRVRIDNSAIHQLFQIDSSLVKVLILHVLRKQESSGLAIWRNSICFHLLQNIVKLSIKVFSI